MWMDGSFWANRERTLAERASVQPARAATTARRTFGCLDERHRSRAAREASVRRAPNDEAASAENEFDRQGEGCFFAERLAGFIYHG